MIEAAIITIIYLSALMITSFYSGWYFRRDLKEKPAIKKAYDDGVRDGVQSVIRDTTH